jgi:flagellar FliL protein
MSEESAPPKKSSKVLLAVIGTAVVTIGAGTGVYFGFLRKEHAADAAPAAAAEPVRLPAQFVELDPPFVVNFEAGTGARFLQIAVQLMTRDPHMVEFLEHNTPIIRNDLLLLFGNKHVEDVATQEGKEALRAAALETVRTIITNEGRKPDALEAVYFTSFVMQ